ncbi:outer membrane beta-barrel protein [Ohtaekwangia sp.]|uniref:outer membrane beta-barrel protein n=1 Tax=Ohtaekwangia sp. TaxID=2066019 RepID=UPI002FDE9DF3
MKHVLMLAMLLSSTCSFAQLAKGNLQLGGSLSYTNQKNDQYDYYPGLPYSIKSTSFALSPRAGLFFSDKSVVGLSLSFTSTTNTSEFSGLDKNQSKNSLFSITPYYRHYKSLGEHAAFFFQGDASIGFGKYKPEGASYDTFYYGVGVRPGVALFLSEKWALEATYGSLSYQSTKYTPDGSDNNRTSNSFGLNLNWLTLAFGVQYFIAR